MTINKLKDTPIGKALVELSNEMKDRNMPPVKLNAVGGFAMLLRGLRPEDSLTDIDYVGSSLPEDFNKIADKIGIKYNLGRHWINNDVMMSGISLEDFESSTGKLHFNHMLTIGNIEINALTESDLMRLKLIAIDTNTLAAESGGRFARQKDLPDMKLLMNRNNATVADLARDYSDFICSDYTLPLINAYNQAGLPRVNKILDTITQKYNAELKRSHRCYPEERSPFVSNLIDNLFAQNKQAQDENVYY